MNEPRTFSYGFDPIRTAARKAANAMMQRIEEEEKMRPKNLQDLIQCFQEALERGAHYVAVRVQMEGFPEDEIIINPHENIQDKLVYYQRVYNEDLTHKFSLELRITGFTYADNLEEIEQCLC